MTEIENMLITTTTVITDSGKTHQWIPNSGREIPREENIHTVSSYHRKGRLYLSALTMQKPGAHYLDQLVKSTVANNGAKCHGVPSGMKH